MKRATILFEEIMFDLNLMFLAAIATLTFLNFLSFWALAMLYVMYVTIGLSIALLTAHPESTPHSVHHLPR